MKSKIISITIFSLLILLIFSFISLISIPWLFASQHQGIAFLGIFLMVFTIPIMLFILFKKIMKIIYIILYFIYYISVSIITFIISVILEKIIYWNNYSFEHTRFSDIFDSMAIYFYLLFFTFQFQIIILCLLIKKIYKSNENINLKYFIKNPLFYIIIFSLSLLPIILFNF